MFDRVLNTSFNVLIVIVAESSSNSTCFVIVDISKLTKTFQNKTSGKSLKHLWENTPMKTRDSFF